MNIPTSPGLHEVTAQDLACMHVGHKIKIVADNDHSISGTLEELRITREQYLHDFEVKRKPPIIEVLISIGDDTMRLHLRPNDKVSVKP